MLTVIQYYIIKIKKTSSDIKYLEIAKISLDFLVRGIIKMNCLKEKENAKNEI